MSNVAIITSADRFEALKLALDRKLGITGMTVHPGHGLRHSERTHKEMYRGAVVPTKLLPKVRKVEMVVSAIPV